MVLGCMGSPGPARKEASERGADIHAVKLLRFTLCAHSPTVFWFFGIPEIQYYNDPADLTGSCCCWICPHSVAHGRSPKGSSCSPPVAVMFESCVYLLCALRSSCEINVMDIMCVPDANFVFNKVRFISNGAKASAFLIGLATCLWGQAGCWRASWCSATFLENGIELLILDLPWSILV